MRTLLIVCGVLVSLSAALGARGRETSPARQLALSPAALQALRAGVPAATLRSLSGTVTRQQQLRWLRSDAVMGQKLQGLGVNPDPPPLGGDPWSTGVTVSPLAPIYPAGANYSNFQIALQSRAVWMSPYAALPAAGQNPPLLWLNQSANCDPLFWVEITWPATGVYMMTFQMKDLLPTSIAKPRVFKNGSGWQIPIPNTASGGDSWSLLWEVSNPNDLHETVGVYPADSGFGFTCCCLSKVVFSRLK
jgi:hypothetical protein